MHIKKSALLVVLALSAQASAADLSKTVWSFVSGKSTQQPMMQGNKDGVVSKVWMMPDQLQAQMALLAYQPKLSTNHWAFTLMGAQLPAADYVGTKTWSLASTIKDPKDPATVMHFNRLRGGLFDGMYMVDEQIEDKKGEQARIFMLLTPQMYDQMQKNRKLRGAGQ